MLPWHFPDYFYPAPPPDDMIAIIMPNKIAPTLFFGFYVPLWHFLAFLFTDPRYVSSPTKQAAGPTSPKGNIVLVLSTLPSLRTAWMSNVPVIIG